MDKKKRQQVTDFIVNAIREIIPDGINDKRTKEILDSLSDKDFIDYINKLGSEEEILSLVVPNGAKVKLSVKRNLDVAKKYNIKFFEKVWLETPDKKGRALSKNEYLILKLPVKRQAQMLEKKIAIPKDDLTIDALTGQPAGKNSKGSRISYPELQMLSAQGLSSSLEELIRYRGGDSRGYSNLKTSISRTGGVSLKAIEPYSGKVKSTETLSAFLSAMHLKNNL